MKKVTIIGIAGGSGSGKTRLVKNILKQVLVFGMQVYLFGKLKLF